MRYADLYISFSDFLNHSIDEKKFHIGNFIYKMENVFTEQGFRSIPDVQACPHILVIRLDAIGDFVLTSGFLRELRRAEPKAFITLVVSPAVYSLAEFCPYVNEVFSFSVEDADFVTQYRTALDFCKQYLWQRQFDLCICPRWDFDRYFTLFLSYISGARERIGYTEKLYKGKEKINRGYDLLLTAAIANPKGIVHEATRNFYLLEKYIGKGFCVKDRSMELWCSKEDMDFASQICGTRPLLAVAIGASEKSKIYPPDKYLEVIKLILQKDSVDCILLGGPEDREVGEKIARELHDPHVQNFAGKTTLRQVAAILQKTEIYIGGDTGLTHIAAAAQIPVLELQRMSANIPRSFLSYDLRFFPWDTPTICLQPKKALGKCAEITSPGGCISQTAHCITQIAPQEVVEGYFSLRKVRICR